ncbi:uncharacterized protein MONBRDRAFT_12184 [Monosiga brevicollis MX1]|uniref:Mitochondrial import inner membrane translocase subunit Tim21 n=1 Tax=Monosiga brevicollis TaxID=81824 RepID=A9VBG9_MONBE|nr:uncharacterized protein MONBRDRAFT_12184 [Monosiga brevicollis MX1]EDQ85059.1 predicted protein [Monosiga brevicollis MX1]|eukprot:XP_001750063.1 hypothetical protein [Monosiga brevicollis MX1]
MASLERLGRIAAGGAILSFGSAFVVYDLVRTSIMNSSYVKEALQLVEASEDARLAFGGVIRPQPVHLFGSQTRVLNDGARVSVPILGKGDEDGHVHIEATRLPDGNTWQLDRCILNVEWPEEKQFVLK